MKEIQSPRKNCYENPIELKVAPPIKNLLKIQNDTKRKKSLNTSEIDFCNQFADLDF